MKNRLTDLNDHLFAELERLGDEELTDEALQKEIDRARAITDVASQVIGNASLALKAEVVRREFMVTTEFSLPKMLEDKKDA